MISFQKDSVQNKSSTEGDEANKESFSVLSKDCRIESGKHS